MAWLVLIIIGGIWLISAISSSVSKTAAVGASNRKRKEEFELERSKKYGEWTFDKSKTLFDRNFPIIEHFANSASEGGSYRSRGYYFENLTRDCINEICLAENRLDIQPGSNYLSTWKSWAPSDWIQLSKQVEQRIHARLAEKKEEQKQQQEIADKERRAELKEKQELQRKRAIEAQAAARIERDINEVRQEIRNAKKVRVSPTDSQQIQKRKAKGEIQIEDLKGILTPNTFTWLREESSLIELSNLPKKFPAFILHEDSSGAKKLNDEIAEYNEELTLEIKAHKSTQKFFKEIQTEYQIGKADAVKKRLDFIIQSISLPLSVPLNWSSEFNEEEKIAVVEIQLPDVVHNPIYKEVQLKSGIVKKLLNNKESKEEIPKIHPAIMLRVAYEIFRNDEADVIDLLVLNGWVEFDDPNTGTIAKTYTASFAVKKNQIEVLNLTKLEPLSAFTFLKGKSAGKLIDIIPVTPILTLDRKDKRFIDTKEVLNSLDVQTNLASMDWQDFESLIAELFQKEFAKEGAEVKVTQASRDRGVDAVIFDPDPIKGGKYIVQAKRYTTTVDVSAVRDLCAVVKKEGASRGILVTTSSYGADAYAFAQNEPVKLMTGAELLGLLEKHGYKFRINLAEARLLKSAE